MEVQASRALAFSRTTTATGALAHTIHHDTNADGQILRAVSSASASVIFAPTMAKGFRPGSLTDQQAFAGAAERLVSVDPALSADSVIT